MSDRKKKEFIHFDRKCMTFETFCVLVSVTLGCKPSAPRFLLPLFTERLDL